MRFFIDTEFTDFKNKGLISIGIVSEDGKRQFYREVSDYNVEHCNDFVKTNVIPLLDSTAIPYNQVAQELSAWLDRMVWNWHDIVIVGDHMFDLDLLNNLLQVSTRFKVKTRLFDDTYTDKMIRCGFDTSNLRRRVRELQMQAHCDYFETIDNRQHHALVDANALRHGWVQGLTYAPVDS